MKYILSYKVEAAEILLQGSKEETRKKMSEEDEARFSLIWNALMIIELYIDLCYITGRCVGNHAPLLYTTI